MMKRIHSQRSVACFKRWNRAGYSAFASMHKQVRIGVLGVGMSIISLTATEANATNVDSLQIFKVVDIDDVGVTLEKENPTRSAMAPTQLFSRATQAAAPLQTLESALRLSPSIDVRERGGKGIQTDLSIRGGSFDQTMVLLNGINFTDARTGHQTHSLPVDIESVAGIDLIDGISGVGAYAGAINIRTAPIKPNYGRIEVVGGEHGYGYANLSGALTRGKFNIYAMGSLRRSDGYTYNTGFENWNGYIRSSYDSEALGFFDAQVGIQRREFGANGFYSLSNPNQYETTKTALASLRWLKKIGSRTTINSSISYRKNLDNYEWIRHSDVGENFHNTDNVGAEAYITHSWKAGRTTVGADYTYNHIWSTNLGNKAAQANGKYTHTDKRNIGNFYLRHSKEWSKFMASASAGVSTTPYGSSPTWSILGRYTPTQGVNIEAGVNESMRLPTFTDLYYKSATQIPDPNLHPESAVTYRIAGGINRSRWSTSAEVYLRKGNNIIDWTHSVDDGVNDSDKDIYHARQITNLSTLGVEWQAGYTFGGIVDKITLSYGYITQDKSSADLISLYAQNYMHNKAVSTIILRPIKSISLVVTGSVYDRAGNYMTADGSIIGYKPYFLLDSRLTWEYRKMRVYVDATNITSTKYFDYGGLQMPKSWATLGVAVTL